VLKRPFFVIAVLVLAVPCARATYSIVACDPQARECGVAVQTNNLAVGASVPYAKAGVGAVASQFETNPMYGPRGLALLAEGRSPSDVMKQLLREDGNFDGEGIEARQVGIVSMDGRTEAYTGAEAAASAWAGARSEKGYSIQGNGLAGPQVVEAMERAFKTTSGALAVRLMAALVAGDAAGGQKTGRESAALLVRTPQGFPRDIDLRVDHAMDPVGELHGLVNIQMARQQVTQARTAANQGRLDEAKGLLITAVARAPMWPRIWTQAAQVAVAIEQPELAVQYLNVVFSMNPAWIDTQIGDGKFAQLGADPLFRRWVTEEQREAARSDGRRLASTNSATAAERLQMASRLLEVGEAEDALKSIAALPDDLPGVALTRATAYEALGRYTDALKVCESGLRAEPKNRRLDLRCSRWRAAFDSRN
jgi:uncharacterized Ntn-hydrolase superfamily protein